MAEHCQHVWKYLHRLIYSGVLQSAQFYLFMWLFWRTPSTLKIAKSSPPQAGVIWGVIKYVITNLKINNFKKKNDQENLTAIFSPQINVDEHVSTKMNTCRIYKGGLGG